MPNIELHVFEKEAEIKLFNRIKEALMGEKFYDDAVVTKCSDGVIDFYGVHKPYVRICSTSYEERILQIFEEREINVDIEIQPVKIFIPAK